MPPPRPSLLRRWFLALLLLPLPLTSPHANPRSKGNFEIGPVPTASRPSTSRGKVVALVIGINYSGTKFSPLRFAEKDATAFAAHLRSQGVSVHLLTGSNATLSAVRATIARLWRQIRYQTDGVLVYFSGHGEKINSKHLLVLADSDPESLEDTGLDWAFLKRKLDETRSRRQILILDACYGAAFTRSTYLAQLEEGEKKKVLERSSSILPGEMQRLFRGQGRISFFSSKAGQTSLEPAEIGHGLYTYYLLQGLKGKADLNGDRCITADELQAYLQDKVYAHAQRLGKQQTPHWSGSKEMAEGFEGRDMLLVRLPGCGAAAPPKPAAVASPSSRVEPSPGASGKLELQANTSKVKVYQDGALRSVLHRAGKRYTLSFPAGRYTLLFKKEGYADLSETVVIAPEESLSLDLDMKRASSSASASSPPPRKPHVAAVTPSEPPPSPPLRTPKDGDRQTFEAKGQTFAMRYIPAGSFLMGSPKDEKGRASDEGPQRRVRITRGFWMLETEVTQDQYTALVGSNPSYFKHCGGTCPVESVDWNQARSFANKLSKAQGLAPCTTKDTGIFQCTGWRLPSEAEWEYAARAGTTTATYNTNSSFKLEGANNAPNLDPIAWYGGNSSVSYEGANDCSGWPSKQYESKTCGPQPVGSKQPNPWGLRDVLGNVWEWTLDVYKNSSTELSTSDPLRTSGSAYRIARGGSWGLNAKNVRSAYRFRLSPTFRLSYLGFRVLRY